jgi:hypothetical protein
MNQHFNIIDLLALAQNSSVRARARLNVKYIPNKTGCVYKF